MSPDVAVSPATGSWSPTLRPITPAIGYSYLLSLPAAYATNPARAWPLILFLHGTAGCGSNPANVTTHGLPRLLAAPPDLSATEASIGRAVAQDFVVVAPQCPYWEVWDENAVLSLLDAASEQYRVDREHVYLLGLSMGGFGVWSIGLRHLERFAALVPVCGGGRIADVERAARERPAALRELRVWAFHGALDPVVPLEESSRMIAALQAAGAREAKLTVYPDALHDAWTATFANPALYRWLTTP